VRGRRAMTRPTREKAFRSRPPGKKKGKEGKWRKKKKDYLGQKRRHQDWEKGKKKGNVQQKKIPHLKKRDGAKKRGGRGGKPQ